MEKNYPKIMEGDLYEILYVDGGTFEIHYGFYEDFERDEFEPIPIYPDLAKTLIYGVSGRRIVTHMQEPCHHFKPQVEQAERCCGCCSYFAQQGNMIDVCLHTELRKGEPI